MMIDATLAKTSLFQQIHHRSKRGSLIWQTSHNTRITSPDTAVYYAVVGND